MQTNITTSSNNTKLNSMKKNCCIKDSPPLLPISYNPKLFKWKMNWSTLFLLFRNQQPSTSLFPPFSPSSIFIFPLSLPTSLIMSSFFISTPYPALLPLYFLFIMHPIHSSRTNWLHYTLFLSSLIALSLPFPFSFPTLPFPPLPFLPSSSLNLEKLSKNMKREKEAIAKIKQLEAQSANVESQREARMKQLEKKHCRSQKNLSGSNEQAKKKKSKTQKCWSQKSKS